MLRQDFFMEIRWLDASLSRTSLLPQTFPLCQFQLLRLWTMIAFSTTLAFAAHVKWECPHLTVEFLGTGEALHQMQSDLHGMSSCKIDFYDILDDTVAGFLSSHTWMHPQQADLLKTDACWSRDKFWDAMPWQACRNLLGHKLWMTFRWTVKDSKVAWTQSRMSVTMRAKMDRHGCSELSWMFSVFWKN